MAGSGSVAVTATPFPGEYAGGLSGARADLESRANRATRVREHLVNQLVGVPRPEPLVCRRHRTEAQGALGHTPIMSSLSRLRATAIW